DDARKVGEGPQGKERGLQVPLVRSTCPLDSGLPGSCTMSFRPRCPHRAATSGCRTALRPTPVATIEESLSTTMASGTPPRRPKHSTAPCRKSAMDLDRLYTTACAAEWGRVVTQP